jgi:asparagine synthetase A
LPGHPTAEWRLPKEITFVTSEELHEEYPDLDVHGRENAIVNKHGAVFIIGMGWPMKDGSAPEEVRSPGYDDWHLNGDIMVKVRSSVALFWSFTFSCRMTYSIIYLFTLIASSYRIPPRD